MGKAEVYFAREREENDFQGWGTKEKKLSSGRNLFIYFYIMLHSCSAGDKRQNTLLCYVLSSLTFVLVGVPDVRVRFH